MWSAIRWFLSVGELLTVQYIIEATINEESDSVMPESDFLTSP